MIMPSARWDDFNVGNPARGASPRLAALATFCAGAALVTRPDLVLTILPVWIVNLTYVVVFGGFSIVWVRLNLVMDLCGWFVGYNGDVDNPLVGWGHYALYNGPGTLLFL